LHEAAYDRQYVLPLAKICDIKMNFLAPFLVIIIFFASCSSSSAAQYGKPRMQPTCSSIDQESREAIRAEIERFVQEEEYKDVRKLCALDEIKKFRHQRAPFW